MIRMQRLLAAAALAAMALTTFAPPSAAADGGTESPAIRIPTVTVATARRAEVVARVPVSGTLVPREEVLVNPRINGYAIEKINVDVGDQVKAGDVLAVLDKNSLSASLAQADAELQRSKAAVRQAQSQIDSAKASLDEAEATLDRSKRLSASGTASAATLSQSKANAGSARAAYASAKDGLAVARAQVLQAKSQRDMAQENLSRARITAPVDGLISARNAKLGAIATAGAEPMFKIIRNGTVEVEAEVIETALGRVKAGDTAQIELAGGAEVEGTVRLVAPTVDPSTRLGTIRITLGKGGAPKAGTFASGWIVTDRHMAVTVPSSAVLTDTSGTHVQVVTQGIVHETPVKAGILAQNGRREIVSGLDAGETVLARAGAFFNDGDKVKPVPAKPGTDGNDPAETASTKAAPPETADR